MPPPRDETSVGETGATVEERGRVVPYPLQRVPLQRLEGFCRAALLVAGADGATADAATRAMLHASQLGIDNHGIRLLDHYVQVIEGGRVNGRPRLSFVRERGCTAVLDGDNGHGAVVAYRAIQKAVVMARTHGMGCVAVRHSSHFGAAGAYALVAAEAGMIGMVTSNSDSLVRLHGGAQAFHGTNPLAFAAPVPGERPWLLDMATSAIPYNRVLLMRNLNHTLPEGVASDALGQDTADAHAAEMLAPLGGLFGYKGAGLAGLIEILSAPLTGAKLSLDLLCMADLDVSTPRNLGHFVMALDPEAFTERSVYEASMRRYVEQLRASAARDGEHVMVPGDREWAEAARRQSEGVPLDPGTLRALRALAERLRLDRVDIPITQAP